MSDNLKTRVEAARKLLAEHGQEHLLAFAGELTDAELAGLLEDIEEVDFELIERLIPQYVRKDEPPKLPEHLEPPAVYPIEPTGELVSKYAKAQELGVRMIEQGKLAGFVVAGGMGTRLGFDGPKGCYPATPIRRKPLFQVFAETIQAAQGRYKGVIPWYVMTSPANHAATVGAFEENEYWGLDRENVVIFQQGMMPCFDFEGRILLAEKGAVAKSPDGHGGSLRALHRSGALADMARRGVEQISYWQVDNPLVKLADPLFLGLHCMDEGLMSSKAVIKAEPLEKVGNFAAVGDRIHVIEYSDLPDELALARREDGELLFELGSIAIHMISRRFVERINEKGFSLPWHRAVKKIGHVDGAGRAVEPQEPNGVKLETFVFDALPMAEKSIILAIDRDEEFAPIKNASGVDSAESSRRLQVGRAARWLEAAGVEVPRDGSGEPEAVIEMAPGFAIEPGEVAEKRGQAPEIKAGAEVYLG